MSLILVIGGYGGFGARLSRRLAGAGHSLLVAGRHAARAQAFCAAIAGARPLVLDRDRDIAPLLARHRPDLVIDAAGPFQASGYGIARACIAAAIPYLDLADGRDFVAGIGALDAEARAAGIAVVAGASSVPALSGAVARRLAEGLDRVDRVDIALSAANGASGGASVIAAILSYVGRPMRLWRGRRWTHGFGWQEMIRADFPLAGGGGLKGRRVALADVPDLALLPALLAGRPSVTFRAGTELGFQMRVLWLASWLVRWRLLGSLRGAGRWLLPLYRLTFGIGGARSAMRVTMTGRDRVPGRGAGGAGGGAVEWSWTLVAERGDGLEIPTLAAALIADDILAGRCPPGARDSASLLTLDRFAPAFAGLAVRHEIKERRLPPPLYARVMGAGFDALAPALRALHDVPGDAGAAGEGQVARGTGLAARLIAAAMRFPPSGTWPLHVAFAEQDGREVWTRDFGGHRFASALSSEEGLLVERFGPLRFGFALESRDGGLDMVLQRWSGFGLPLPRRLAPRIAAREWQEGERFRFDVRVALPLAGEIVHYCGWLAPV